MSLRVFAILCVHVAAGAALGLVYLRSLRSSVDRLTAGGSLAAIAGLMLARLALLGGILGLAALEGAMPLLALAFGFMASRWVLMRRVTAAAP